MTEVSPGVDGGDVGFSTPTLNQMLKGAVERGASDIHLKAGQPPIVRFEGQLEALEGWPALDSARLDDICRAPGHFFYEYPMDPKMSITSDQLRDCVTLIFYWVIP